MTDTAADLADLVPGARIIEGFEVPEDLDAPIELPYGDNPPLEWFTEVHHDVVPGATGLITADGRFCAYSHEWARCHNGFTADGTCWTPPRSVTGNRYFQQSTVVTAEGVQIPVGVIPLGEGHAPIDATVAQAQQWYDRPELIRVRARAVETEHGAVMCGAIVPGTTHREVALMRAAALSGDWRWVPELGSMEFLGPCFVARPGLPIGLEHAAIDQALWDLTRQPQVATAATGEVRAVVLAPVAWSPRPPVVDNVEPAVIAAAQGAAMSPAPSPSPTSSAATAATSCQCGGGTPSPGPVQATAGVAPRRARAQRSVSAAAGTPFSYRELDDQVRAAVTAEFGRGDNTWAWVKDWDDAWVVFELEFEDPIDGFTTSDHMASMAFGADGTVTIDRGSVVEVTTTFVPVPGAEMVPAAQPGPEGEAVAAHAADSAAIAAVSGQLADLSAQVAALAADVGRMQAEGLPAVDAAEVLPEPPELS